MLALCIEDIDLYVTEDNTKLSLSPSLWDHVRMNCSFSAAYVKQGVNSSRPK